MLMVSFYVGLFSGSQSQPVTIQRKKRKISDPVLVAKTDSLSDKGLFHICGIIRSFLANVSIVKKLSPIYSLRSRFGCLHVYLLTVATRFSTLLFRKIWSEDELFRRCSFPQQDEGYVRYYNLSDCLSSFPICLLGKSRKWLHI